MGDAAAPVCLALEAPGKGARRKMEKLSTPKEHEELLFVAVKEEHT